MHSLKDPGIFVYLFKVEIRRRKKEFGEMELCDCDLRNTLKAIGTEKSDLASGGIGNLNLTGAKPEFFLALHSLKRRNHCLVTCTTFNFGP